MALRNFVVDSAVSLGASADGTAIPVDKNIEGFCIAAVISSSSSPVGTLKLQACIDTGSTPTNWADISDSSTSAIADGTILWNIDAHSYKWVRTVYTRTSGSATMTTTFNENV